MFQKYRFSSTFQTNDKKKKINKYLYNLPKDYTFAFCEGCNEMND